MPDESFLVDKVEDEEDPSCEGKVHLLSGRYCANKPWKGALADSARKLREGKLSLTWRSIDERKADPMIENEREKAEEEEKKAKEATKGWKKVSK